MSVTSFDLAKNRQKYQEMSFRISENLMEELSKLDTKDITGFLVYSIRGLSRVIAAIIAASDIDRSEEDVNLKDIVEGFEYCLYESYKDFKKEGE
jgi:hypothetical protein